MQADCTRLLVSVRCPREAALALRCGADLIDVKEPRHGPLGRAAADVIEEIVRLVAERVTVSVALGELRHGPEPFAGMLPAGVCFAKVGLSGCKSMADWQYRWRSLVASLPAETAPVAVAYADWRQCDAPLPEDALSQGAALGAAAALLDTFDKSRGDLFEVMPLPQVAQWIATARDLGLQTVVGGSLSAARLREVLPLSPDYIAVRGAVCAGGREASLDGGRLRRLRELLDLLQRGSGN